MLSQPPSPDTAAPPDTVHVVASTAQEASLLIAILQPLLGANTDFHLKAASHHQFGKLPHTTQQAVLLLAPTLTASNAEASQAQTAMMQLRQALVARQQPFQVLYAQGAALVDDAMNALCNWFPDAPSLQARRSALREHGNLARWSWACEKCSDPECELRLFKGLVG